MTSRVRRSLIRLAPIRRPDRAIGVWPGMEVLLRIVTSNMEDMEPRRVSGIRGSLARGLVDLSGWGREWWVLASILAA